jgi:hypothetical protein
MDTTPLPPLPWPHPAGHCAQPTPFANTAADAGEPQPGPMSDSPRNLRAVKSAPRQQSAAARAREHLQRQQTRDARSFGGRRTGLLKDEAELARLAALDARLLELARRAVRKHL